MGEELIHDKKFPLSLSVQMNLTKKILIAIMQVLIHDNSQMIVIRTRRGKKNQLSSVYELVPQIEAEKK